MTNALQSLLLHNIFDGHTHWRQKPIIRSIAPRIMAHFSGSEIMPNTNPYLIRLDDLKWYREEVFEEIDANGGNFLPIFSMYLSEDMVLKELVEGWDLGLFGAIKYYPKGGTTGSSMGLEGFKNPKTMRILALLQEVGIPLLIHGETPAQNGVAVNDFKREKLFMETEIVGLVKLFQRLKISLEHISTEAAVNFILNHENVIGTVTGHHCLLDSRALYNGVSMEERRFYYDLKKNGSYPSMVCRPILKFEEDMLAVQSALIQQAQNGWKKLGFGSDIAWHPESKKHCEMGACGVYTAPITVEMVAMAFEEMGILYHMQDFMGTIMPEFYGIKDKLPQKTILLSPTPQLVPEMCDGTVPPFAGLTIPWTATAA